MPSPAGCCKVNFDAATFNSLNVVGIGMIIRDEEGIFLAASSEHIETPMSPALAKLVAAL